MAWKNWKSDILVSYLWQPTPLLYVYSICIDLYPHPKRRPIVLFVFILKHENMMTKHS